MRVIFQTFIQREIYVIHYSNNDIYPKVMYMKLTLEQYTENLVYCHHRLSACNIFLQNIYNDFFGEKKMFRNEFKECGGLNINDAS